LDVLYKKSSIQQLATFLDNKKKFDTSIDFHREAGLNPEITKNINKLPKSNGFQNVLLTGVTGFLGSFLLKELIESTQAVVYCLVRSNSDEQAMQRGTEALKEKQIELIDPQRVRWVRSQFFRRLIKN
jgi:FlaA1/EpsC-like NDP-sugar epimerase